MSATFPPPPALPPLAPHRVVHIHVPKTAGTAVRVAVQARRAQGWRAPPHLSERNFEEVAGGDFNYFIGHIGTDTARKVGGEIVTVLRDPIDRIVSCYHFWRELHESGKENTPKSELAARYSLVEFLAIKDELALIDELFNHVTWQIACGSQLHVRREARRTHLPEEAVLAKAVGNLESFAVVGLHERMDGFVAAMERRFGLALALPRVNVTQSRIARADLPARVVRLAYEWAYLDLELYRIAAGLAA